MQIGLQYNKGNTTLQYNKRYIDRTNLQVSPNINQNPKYLNRGFDNKIMNTNLTIVININLIHPIIIGRSVDGRHTV